MMSLAFASNLRRTNMRLKIVVGILSAVLLCPMSTKALIKSMSCKNTIQAQEPVNKPKIKAVQLFPETGTLPVELELISEEAQDLTNTNASPKIHFRIKNNSPKAITAYQVGILADTGNGETKSQVEMHQDFAPHPDIRDYD